MSSSILFSILSNVRYNSIYHTVFLSEDMSNRHYDGLLKGGTDVTKERMGLQLHRVIPNLADNDSPILFYVNPLRCSSCLAQIILVQMARSSASEMEGSNRYDPFIISNLASEPRIIKLAPSLPSLTLSSKLILTNHKGEDS